MFAFLKKAFVIILICGISGVIGGIVLSLLTVFISGSIIGLHDLSYSVVMFSSTLPVAVLLCGLIGAIIASPIRQKAIGSKLKVSAVSFAVLLLIVSNTWLSLRSPEFYLRAIRWTDNQDPETRAFYIKKLTAIGPRSIEPVITEIRNSGTRSRSTWQLNVALKGLNGDAHRQLLKTIDGEKDDWKRIHLIDSLQEAFGDFSRVHLYLKSLGSRKSSFYASALERQLAAHFQYKEQVPSIFTDFDSGRFTPTFIKWYQSKSVPKGSLPHWKP